MNSYLIITQFPTICDQSYLPCPTCPHPGFFLKKISDIPSFHSYIFQYVPLTDKDSHSFPFKDKQTSFFSVHLKKAAQTKFSQLIPLF